MKDDHPVGTGERVHAEKDGDLHSLKISEVDIEDEGTYMCQAKNTAGTATSMADLNVECRWNKKYETTFLQYHFRVRLD